MVKFNGTFSDRRNSKSNAKKPAFFLHKLHIDSTTGWWNIAKKSVRLQ